MNATFRPHTKRSSMRDRCDQLFRNRIRERDEMRCQAGNGAFGTYCAGGTPEVAHFYRRRALSVRWDDDNACLLCIFHHRFLDEHPPQLWSFVQERLGAERFLQLQARHAAMWNKDYTAVLERLRVGA